MLTFREADHTYWLGEHRIPGVTSVLKPLCSFDHVRAEVLERKTALGRMVHTATEFLDEDDLDWDSLHPNAVPYVRAWDRFRTDHGVEVLASERRVFHPLHRYAGQLDRIVRLHERVGLLDLKTCAQMSPVTGLQTAAYLQALVAEHQATPSDVPLPTARFGLQLRPDGSYRLHEYNSARDWPTFLALLTLQHWQTEHIPYPSNHQPEELEA